MANTRETMGEQACLDAILDGTISDFEEDGVSSCRGRLFYGAKNLESINLPNVTSITANFAGYCTHLKSVNLPKVTALALSVFEGCENLTTVNVPLVTAGANSAFKKCYKLSQLTIGKLTSIPDSCFLECSSLDIGDIDISSVSYFGPYCIAGTFTGSIVVPEAANVPKYGVNSTRISTIDFGTRSSIQAISSCYSLYHVILRNENTVCTKATSSDTIATLLGYTPIIQGNGWIYVPDSLLNDYKESDLWSPISSQIVSLNEYPKKIQDETVSDSWSDIAASTTYTTDYPIGSIKYIDIDGLKVAMELVATDTDDLASGGKAKMTWLSRGVVGIFPMCCDSSMDVSWADSDMRSYLSQKIFPKIEQDVRFSIKNVTKTYCDSSNVTSSTTDKLWIPSRREISGLGESSGCDYLSYFTNAAKIQRRSYGTADTYSTYFLRTQQSEKYHNVVGTNGVIGTANSWSSSGIVLGFCI